MISAQWCLHLFNLPMNHNRLKKSVDIRSNRMNLLHSLMIYLMLAVPDSKHFPILYEFEFYLHFVDIRSAVRRSVGLLINYHEGNFERR